MDFNKVFRSRLWDYRPEIKTTAQLEQNFKEILERNNRDQLDRPLSSAEFQQVMDQINALTTPYKAGKFLYGYHGVSQVQVKLDDGRNVFLTVFDQSQVGAGNTVYQVVNQIERPAVVPGYKNRRFDVTLLINGLPIYQIELKGPEHDVDEALNQMQQYSRENQYSGIFSTVQVLMAMTPYNTKYMSRPKPEDFNKGFAFTWKTADNRNVRDWHYIADHMLTIPAAHQLAPNYMILDGTRKSESIKVMRPYQVIAIREALEAVRKTDFSERTSKDGYIWHTTGSGKTITSYKTASLASKLPNIDKVVFLVDRKSLTRQTLESYRGYDPETSDSDEINQYFSIESARNTGDLEKKLNSKKPGIIIASTQKMQRLIKKEDFKPTEQHILFIVDEAHRSTQTDIFENIQKAFPHSAWLGYSGTPNFDENMKGRRTVDIFGQMLHAYTIREAISDGSVLGFKVECNKTVPDEVQLQQMKDYYHELKPEWTDEEIQEKILHLTPDDMDDNIRSSFYDNNQEHIKAVVRDIIAGWENRSNDWKYNALLTTHVSGRGASIPMALKYYEEFKKQNAKREQLGLRPLKVAVSVGSDETNSDNMNEVNQGLERAIEDYNLMFNTKYDISTIDEYNMDLEDRLRKNTGDGNYLDLVIVVDRLLTGFDAPELNTLYVDRILRGAGLIQAYSRTNRIHNMTDKPFGNVVNYRWADYAEKLMNEALSIYSNRDNANLTPEQQGQINVIDNIVALPFADQIEKTKKLIQRIEDLTDGFNSVPDSLEKKEELLKKIRQYNGQLAKLKQYPLIQKEDGETLEGYDYKHPELLLSQLGLTDNDQHQINVTLRNELVDEIARAKNIPPQLIELRVEHLKDVLVDYDFLTELLEDLMNQVHDKKMEEAAETKEKIRKFSKTMDDRIYAKQVQDAADAIYYRVYPNAESGLTYPYRLTSTKELMKNIQQAQIAYIDYQMLGFREKWGIQDIVDSGTLRRLISPHLYGKNDLDKTIIDDIIRKGSDVYTKMAQDEEIRSLGKLRYRNRLREAIMELADEQALE